MPRSKEAITRGWQNQEANDPARANNKVRLLQSWLDRLDKLAAQMGADGRAPAIYQLIEDGEKKYGKKRRSR